MYDSRLLCERFQDFVVDVKDPNYIQHKYESFWTIKINKSLGGDLNQTVGEIRSILNVTIVVKDQELEITSDYIKNIYNIKFALEGGENVKKYIRQTLYPELNKIKGLKVIRFNSYNEIK